MELAFLYLRAQLNRRALLRGRWRDGGDAPPPPVLEFEADVCWARQGIDPGCDFCYDACPKKGLAVIYRRGFGPIFHPDHCTACKFCTYYCPAAPQPITIRGV